MTTLTIKYYSILFLNYHTSLVVIASINRNAMKVIFCTILYNLPQFYVISQSYKLWKELPDDLLSQSANGLVEALISIFLTNQHTPLCMVTYCERIWHSSFSNNWNICFLPGQIDGQLCYMCNTYMCGVLVCITCIEWCITDLCICYICISTHAITCVG